MDEKTDLSQYNQLKKELNFHNYQYHVLDSPLVSDAEFDQMLVALRKMEADHPDWVTPDSPTQRAGSLASERFTKVRHPAPVLSLANAFSPAEVGSWAERMERLDSRVAYADFVLEPKIDGLTVVLTYENGLLVRGATRGDGVIGEDITTNIRTVKSIPLAIPAGRSDLRAPETLVVRGEIYMLNSDFEKLNEEMIAAGEKPYLNPRNTAAGSLRQLNSEITAKRPLKIFTYQILQSSDPTIAETQWATLEYLKEMGFPVSSDSIYCEDRAEMLRRLEDWSDIRDRLDYDIDGVVIKINDLRVASGLGTVGKDPRGAIALKFPAREKTTVLENIGVNVGRTGVLTPYAMLQPVEIGGVIVKQATLHNFDFIRDRDIRIGDTVLVKRAGEVIPYIIGPIVEKRDGSQTAYTMPERCPSCGELTEKIEGEVALYCVNNACPAQLIRNIEHFASRGAMDINGLGIKIVEQIAANLPVHDVADIYSLTEAQLLTLDGFGEKKAENLLNAIEASKQQPLGRLINGLGIHGIGEVMADMLAREYRSLTRLATVTDEELMTIDGVGPNAAKAITDWFSYQTNSNVLAKLRAQGVWPEMELPAVSAEDAPLPLAGMTIVVTGTLEGYTRDEIKAVIQRNGGKSVDSVSRNTSFVLVGAAPGSKREKAISLNVPIYSEAEFDALIGKAVVGS